MSQNNRIPLAVVIIPTFNEVENIRKMIPVLCKEVFPIIGGWRMAVLVVDGNSPDGTDKVVEEYSKTYSNVYLVKENGKNGIGAAYMQGFEYAMKDLSAEVVIEFDADFQHPPETIQILLKKMDEGYDYVAGSRRTEGGSEPEGRNIFRRLLTEVGGVVARAVLFFPGKYFSLVTDPTTGLKATRVKGCLEKIDLDPTHLISKKFGYKLQLYYEILNTGARYAEIPLEFGNRFAGDSKFEADTIWDILKTCLVTRWRGKRNV